MGRFVLPIATIILAVSLPAAQPATAQDVRGFVRDAVTGAPIAGAVVMVLATNREPVARGLTSSAGAFRLQYATGAIFRVIRIGYAPHEVPLQSLGEPPLTIKLESLGRAMDRVSVRANPVCPRRDDQREALALWSSATDALLAMVVASTETSQSGTVTQLEYNRLMDPGGRRIEWQGSRRVVTGNASPIRADRDPVDFVTEGYVVKRGYTMTYYGPDAKVLLDSTFAASHCLSMRSDERGHPGQVGVAFAPPRDRTEVSDIAGVLWLKRDPLALHSLDFEYRGVDQAVIDMRGGGRLAFETLSNGVPMISSWFVRSPRLMYLPAGTFLRGRAVKEAEVASIHEIYETGGIIADGLLSDGTTWSAPLGTLGGLVLTMRTGEPVPGAVVTMDSTDQSAVTDSTGQFAFDELLPGPYTIRVRDSVTIMTRLADSATSIVADSSIQQRITRVATRAIVVRARSTAPIEIRLPWRESVLGCGVQEAERRFFVMGVVMTPDSAPVPNAQVRLSWSDDVRGGMVETLIDTKANGDGAFFVCGIPAERELATRVVMPAGAELIGTSRVSRSSPNPDGSESSMRAMLITVSPSEIDNTRSLKLYERPASVAGIVLDSTGAPFPGVTVRLGSTPFRSVAGDDGKFRLDSLPAGQFTLLAENLSYGQAGSFVADTPVELREGAAAASQTLRARNTAQLVARVCGGKTPGSENGTVRVIVTDSATAEPLPSLRVWMRWVGRYVGSDPTQMMPTRVGGSETLTDASGVASFCDVPGDMNLWFSAVRPDGKAAADSIALRAKKGELRVFQVKTTPPHKP